jgi:hypothetical protein
MSRNETLRHNTPLAPSDSNAGIEPSGASGVKRRERRVPVWLAVTLIVLRWKVFAVLFADGSASLGGSAVARV